MSNTSDRIVVVGVDGSNGSVIALQWAIDHADQLGDIQPVMTFVSGPFEYGFEAVETFDDPRRGDDVGEPYRAEASLRLRTFLQAHAPSLAEAGVVIEHRAGPGLVKAAASAELLVVGTRGWSSRVDLSIGSVGAYCAHHATVPVALVPHDVPRRGDHLRVVVGFDGSSHAHRALRWALTHVRPSDRVTVVRAYTEDSIVGEPLAPSTASSEETARADLTDGVAAVLGRLDAHPAVDLAVLPGDPRAVLRSVSDDADLLVVGARGHGVIDRLLLGSVASALAHHPTIPTIVVPHHR